MSYGYFPVDLTPRRSCLLALWRQAESVVCARQSAKGSSHRVDSSAWSAKPSTRRWPAELLRLARWHPSSCAENRKDYLHIALKVVRSHTHETEELTWSKGIGLLGNI